jgi:hypothetical protein
MTKNITAHILAAGLIGGSIGNGVLGTLLSRPLIREMPCSPDWQSPRRAFLSI